MATGALSQRIHLQIASVFSRILPKAEGWFVSGQF
jgi:hypothetical protein